MMDADEREIFFYLRSEQGSFVPAAAICRHAGGKHKFREAPDWARPAIMRMLERGILETDSLGAYRLKPVPRAPASELRWVSPQIAEALRRSGKQFKNVIAGDEDDEAYYNSL